MGTNDITSLVDDSGRCIPSDGLVGSVFGADREHTLAQPSINSTLIWERLVRFFAPGTDFGTTAKFENQIVALTERVACNDLVANLLKGVCLPVVIPRIQVENYDRTFKDVFLAAASAACVAQPEERRLVDYRSGTQGLVIAQESRHQRLIDAVSVAPVVLLYFPQALQGFSIAASRETVGAFPDGFVLSGAIDIATSIVAYTSVLCRDSRTPVYDCAANNWKSPECSLFFACRSGRLVLDTTDITKAGGSYSGGLCFFL